MNVNVPANLDMDNPQTHAEILWAHAIGRLSTKEALVLLYLDHKFELVEACVINNIPFLVLS